MSDIPTVEFGFAEVIQKVAAGGSRKLRILHQKYKRANGTSYWRQVGNVPLDELKNVRREADAVS